MKLEINEIYHHYIVKIVVFSLFLYKVQIRQPNVYKLSVISFVNKRLPWKVNLVIDTGEKMDKKEERDMLLGELLDGVEYNHLSKILVSFTTPLMETTMMVDLKDESKYQQYLYM